MTSAVKRWIGVIACAAFMLAVPPVAASAPIASLEYVETALGAGLVQDQYTLTGLGDAVSDAGFNIYDLTIFFSPAIAFDNGSATTWDVIGGAGFVNAFSLTPGLPPSGTDLGPGQSLNGFRFVFTGAIGNASFSVLFNNPADVTMPIVFEGVSTSAPAVPDPSQVPEPASLMLIGGGLMIVSMVRRTTPRLRQRP